MASKSVPVITSQEQLVRTAQVLAGASRDKDTRLLEKHWDKVVGMDSVKEELLRVARALHAVPAPGPALLGENTAGGKPLPAGYQIGGWVEHHSGGYWGRLLAGRTKRALVAVHWIPKDPDRGSDEITGGLDFTGLQSHKPLPGDPRR